MWKEVGILNSKSGKNNAVRVRFAVAIGIAVKSDIVAVLNVGAILIGKDS